MTTRTPIARSKAGGFSLLEVLVAVVVLSVGLLALAALQGALIRGTSSAKAQTQAMALAQEKMEQLRGFTTSSANTDSYAAIVAGSDTVTIGANTFTRTVAVTRYQYQASATGGGSFVSVSNDPATVAIGNNEFKNVTVDVSWTNESGQTTDIQLADAVSVSSPSDSLNALATPTSGHMKPQVWIDPKKFAAGVIPIALGTSGQSAAASDPQPESFSTGHITTRFSVQNYNTTQNSHSLVLLNKQFDFALTSCTCNMAGASTSSSPAYGPTYWNGTRYIAPATVVGKPTGSDPVSNGNANHSSQDPVLCQACCRDHHDVTVNADTYPVQFDPFRPKNEYVNGEHKHYDTNNSNVLQTSAASTTSGTEYYETCRLVRVDGINYVSTDARQENHLLIAPVSPITVSLTTTSCDPSGDSITSGSCKDHLLDSATSTTTYPNFVKDYVTGYYNAWKTAEPAGTYPLASGASAATIGDLLVSGGSPTTLATTYASLVNPPSQTAVTLNKGDVAYMEGRGIYIDYISKETKTALNCIGQPASNTDCTAFRTADVLQVLPFVAVNQTNLDSWGPVTTSTTIAVTDTAIPSGGTYDPEIIGYTFDRGTTTAKAAGTDNATAQARLGNAGLIDSVSVSPSYPYETYNCFDSATSTAQVPCSADPPTGTVSYDTSNSSSTGPRFQKDVQPFTVSGSSGNSNPTFNISYTDNSPNGNHNFNSSSINISVTSPSVPSNLASCALTSNGKQPYTCHSSDSATSITLLFVGYNSQVSCTPSKNKTCPNPADVNDYKICSISGLPTGVTAAIGTIVNSGCYTAGDPSGCTAGEQTPVTFSLPSGSTTTQIAAYLASMTGVTANFYPEGTTCPP